MTTPRDTQRSRVYDAEHLVHRLFDRSAQYPVIEVAGSRLTLPVERRFASVDSVQSYVDKVLVLGWVRASWARAAVPVVVRGRAGDAQAHYERAGAVMAVPAHRSNRSNPAWAMRELVVLHELSHHLADGPEVAHGPEFADRMLTVVDGIIGPEAALLLRVTLLDNGVRMG
jgi:putative metallohydrolase (TIGR04338 family)